ncbi:hypothetical protein Ae201684P_010558 [Aphanomyces euteiches]|uniref:C2 domain-containing protein n=1 Tax=Aphanomyces euteiches TaxID=100861 RepID=A0A6G0WPP1_9STRA|nr:hypothetical protein Ae201684_013086 [Aphanomyces euteiches]KAH9076618.1 hypothetical protein Ae201684P_010558 [Aphanomyces euteiches]
MLGILVWLVVAAATSTDPMELSKYLSQRQNDSLLCLYLFDGAPSELGSVVPGCPFGTLRPTPTLVEPLGSDQVGYRWSPTPKNGTIQLESNDVAISRTFYETALSYGLSFELILRLYKPTPANVNVNLFAIASPYDDCTHPGFRVEVSDRQLLVLIFYAIKADNQIDVCFELHFYSMMEVRGSKPCMFPLGTSRDDPPPLVHVIVSIAPNDPTPGEWTTMFHVSFTNPDGTRQECFAYNSMDGVPGFARFDNVRGNYRLYLGNNGRLGLAKKRRPIKPSREPPRPPPAPTRVTSYDLLDAGFELLSIAIPQPGGFFFSVNGKKSIDIDENGVSFGPNGTKFSRDTIKNALERAIEKAKSSSIMTGLVHRKDEIIAQLTGTTPPGTVPFNASIDWAKAPPNPRYPPPNASTEMDLFFFAIATTTFLVHRIKELAAMELPHLGTQMADRTISIAQDSSVRLRLREFALNRLHDSVQITQLPEFGKLTRCGASSQSPETLVTVSTKLDDLCVVYTPDPNTSNANVPNTNPYLALLRAKKPFSTIAYSPAGVSTSTQKNKSMSARIHIFVTPKDDGKASPKTKNVTSALAIQPPWNYTSFLRPYQGFNITIALQLIGILSPEALIRVTLDTDLETRIRVQTDPLKSYRRVDYCPQLLKFDEVCYAQDVNGSGIMYELEGLVLGETQVKFRGTLAQIQHALTNLSIATLGEPPREAKLKVKLEPINHSAFRTMKQMIKLLFAFDYEASDACTPLFSVFPFVCEEYFGQSGIWGTIMSGLVVVSLVSAWRRRQLRRVNLSTVQNAAEFNAIIGQLQRVFQEPNMQAASALVDVCDTRHERTIALVAVSLILTQTQTMPRFLAHISTQVPRNELDWMVRFYCRLIGRPWINGVLHEANRKSLTSSTPLVELVITTIEANIASVPMEIVLLSPLSSPTFGFVDHFVVPGFQDCMLLPEVVVIAEMEWQRLLKPSVAALLRRRSASKGYIPTRARFPGDEELIPQALLHVLHLVAKNLERMVARCSFKDYEDVPPVGIRLEQIVHALKATKAEANEFLRLTKDFVSLRF